MSNQHLGVFDVQQGGFFSSEEMLISDKNSSYQKPTSMKCSMLNGLDLFARMTKEHSMADIY
jgi:hypothetical protein